MNSQTKYPTIDEFPVFFQELHGVPPFHWQTRLTEKITLNGWPDILDLPTSVGKTSAMDSALFHLASQAAEPPEKRTAPTRIFFVVDRRLVVDEAYERAQRMQRDLKSALQQGSVLGKAARALQSLGQELHPLDIVRLRGGLPHEPSFISNPAQPTVILSTVDQVGSRLLFRGYGVSETMRPIHAALTAMDSLIILDEAHLSRPLRETLDWIHHFQGKGWRKHPSGKPAVVVQMTATPDQTEREVFTLGETDWQEKEDNKVLPGRLIAQKWTKLEKIKGDKDDLHATRKKLACRCHEEAKHLMKDLTDNTNKSDGCPVVGVIVNRVATARTIFEKLHQEAGTDALLLTGKNRDYERNQLVNAYLGRMKAGRGPEDNTRPLYVVATQTVEVGADIDFNGLISESAALDALRQRFGRLNRLGQWNDCWAIVIHVDYGKAKTEDLVYGQGIKNTWNWLEKKSKKSQKIKWIDFGIQNLSTLLQGSDLSTMQTPYTAAPILTPAHMDLLVQTCPTPEVEPDLALYLHGADSRPPDVQLIWRADLPKTAPEDRRGTERIIEIVSLLPPTQSETIDLPVWAVRAFFDNLPADEVNDVEGGAENDQARRTFRRKNKEPNQKYALCWRGTETSYLVRESRQIRPGETLVLPVAYGGMDRYGWNPGLKTRVRDIADQTISEKRGKVYLRLHPDLVETWFSEGLTSESAFAARTLVKELLDRIREGDELSDAVSEVLNLLLELSDLDENTLKYLTILQKNHYEIPYPDKHAPEGVLLVGKNRIFQEITDDDDASSLTKPDLLENHGRQVGQTAQHFGNASGLKAFSIELRHGGKYHDLGKADQRFQLWLRGGDKVIWRKDHRLLAKSDSMVSQSISAIMAAQSRAGYPRGGRHECYSVALYQDNICAGEDTEKDNLDQELITYLIGVHHGRGRALMPAVKDDGWTKDHAFSLWEEEFHFKGHHGLEYLGSGWTDLFWRLIRRYGYWGLAYLESMVRLADHHCSKNQD